MNAIYFTEMGKAVEDGRPVEAGSNWEISVTSPTRLEVDPQLSQAARLTPRPDSEYTVELSIAYQIPRQHDKRLTPSYQRLTPSPDSE
jgi:hypothetical protein